MAPASNRLPRMTAVVIALDKQIPLVTAVGFLYPFVSNGMVIAPVSTYHYRAFVHLGNLL